MNFENMTKFILTVVVVTGILFIFRAFLFKFLHRWASKTQTDIDNIIINTIKTPFVLLCVGIGLHVAVETSEIPTKYSFYLIKIIHTLLVLFFTIAVANVSTQLFTKYIEKKEISIQSTSLLNIIIKIAIYLIGFIIILSIFGVSIAPLITALGIGGLAIGLALKDTLENLFAGIHIMTEKTVRVGDFVQIDKGQEGFVEDISWRTTRIRTRQNNMIVIPNSKLAQSIVVNYHLPEKRMALQIPISVSYSSDPEKVEKILIEETKKALNEIPGLLPEPEPFVRLIPGFGESSLDFTLICQISEVSDQFIVQHELRKRIFKRFIEEGIEIPFPQRVVWLKREN